jgi:ATP-dependent RNA helicase DHX8/PRP22
MHVMMDVASLPWLQAVPKDLSRPWEDPLPEAGERQLAQGMRGSNLAAREEPEWKLKAMGKAATLGRKDVRSIQEQRESLPIYRLKDQLIQAVHDNQVLVVIGETGEAYMNCSPSTPRPQEAGEGNGGGSVGGCLFCYAVWLCGKPFRPGRFLHNK